MKKWIAMLLALMMLLSLAACGAGESEPADAGAKDSQSADENALSTEPEEQETETETQPADEAAASGSLKALVESGALDQFLPAEDENSDFTASWEAEGNDTLVMKMAFRRDLTEAQVAAAKEEYTDDSEIAGSMGLMKSAISLLSGVADPNVKVLIVTNKDEVIFEKTY